MSVSKRGSRWYVRYRPSGRTGPYSTIILDNEAEARALNASLIRELAARREGKPKAYGSTVSELWEGYEAYIELHRKRNTYLDVQFAGKRICRLLGKYRLEQLTNAHVELYQRSRKKDPGKWRDTLCTNRTINKELSWFSGFLKWVRKQGLEAPALSIEKLPQVKKLPIILTVQECMALLRELPPLYRAYCACLYLTGMRLGEVRALQKADIDWQNNTITARDTKSGRDKILAMPVWLRAMLMEIVEENDSPFVFISRHTGKPWIDITWPLQKAAAAAGITKHVHPHLLRHSIASHLTDLGTSIRVIQSFLGHSDIQMSAWYAQVSAANKQGVAGVIDSMTSFPLDK